MIGFYFDEHMARPVARGLIQLGYRVVMAVDVGMTGKDDDTEHLPYATKNDCIMVTFDHPFATRTFSRTDHLGLVCLPYKMRDDIGQLIKILDEFVQLYDSQKDVGQVFFLR